MDHDRTATPAPDKEIGALSTVGPPTILIAAFLHLFVPLSNACRCRSSQSHHPVCAMYASAMTLFYRVVHELSVLHLPDLLDISFVSETSGYLYRILSFTLIARVPPDLIRLDNHVLC